MSHKRHEDRPSGVHPEQLQIYTVYYEPTRNSWNVKDRWARITEKNISTKRKAVKRGRKLAKKDWPSKLQIKNKNGKVGDTVRYDN